MRRKAQLATISRTDMAGFKNSQEKGTQIIMNPKLKRLIGSLLFILFLAFYVVVVIAVAYGILPGKSQGFQLLFMAIAGTIWVLPGAVIIKWLAK